MKRHATKPFALLGVNTDTDKQDYRSKALQYGLTWRSAWDASTSGPWVRAWGIGAFPSTVVLDAQHRIRSWDARGPELERIVAQLLDELAAED